ncbi:enoyl-CoA hydratase-related protein, partial [Turicimonas muris]
VAEGVALLYHCDLVFCGEHALFALPNIALGKTPLYGISLLAVKSAGYKLAAQKILLSEPISPSEAIAMGIINHVLEDDKVLPQTFLAATRLGNLPPKALNATKRLLKAAYLSGTKEQKELEQETFDQLVDGAEMKEAFNAFMEKRKPNFD